MKTTYVKYIITLPVFLVLGGLFYFLLQNKETVIVAENEDVKSIKTTENIHEISGDMGQISEVIEKDDENNENIQETTEHQEIDVAQSEKKDEKNVDNYSNGIKDKLVSWGFATSAGRNIDTIVIHSSYDALGDKPYDVEGLITEYKEYGVAPHYLIDRKGNTYRLVADKNIAWHAGVSQMPDGRENVNNFSIGIEIMNTKTDEYTKKQYKATQSLIDYLKNLYDIENILGHDEIAPDRKTDPWNFDWNKISIK